ncbi:MAG: 2-amino-4-hydroxy-6-hydroxymethyldihydropteridine diphosphokinase [Planctomyces sp.]|nr:2-amino-4-hydroxy-6-hydroxymethyldihydropteridine diphosphokinase [Planctomyces sp.]
MTDPGAATSGGGAYEAILLLGSNIDPERNLPRAIAELRRVAQVLAASSVWQTAPVGDPHQADFCNAAVRLRTDLDPQALRVKLRGIEDRLGRVRDPSNKNAARTIDLDIAHLRRVDDGQCLVYDPELRERVFAAASAAELAPDLRLPDGERLCEAAARLRARDAARLRLTRREDLRLNAAQS